MTLLRGNGVHRTAAMVGVAGVVGVVGLGLAAALAVSCGSARPKRPKDLSVMSYSPTEAIDAAQSIEIQFDRPVIEVDQVGRPVDPGWISIAPAFAWTGHWRDRQTMVIEPGVDLAGGTRYQVSLAGPLADRTDHFRFGFVHQPLAVDGVWGIDTESLPPEGPVPVAFNLPVKAKDAAAHCDLVGDDGTHVTFTAAEPDKIDTTAQLVPKKRLGAGTGYLLRCEGVTPANGNAPLAETYELDVRARPPLTVLGMTPDTTGVVPVPADEVSIEIGLATEVDLDAIRKAVTATPAIPGLDQGWLDGSGRMYRVTVDLAENATYKIAVAGLTDVHGQTLATAFTGEISTGAARSRLSMEAGIYALEASAKGYPVWTRNVTAYQLECAAIPRGKLVALLTGEMNYDPWGGNDDSAPIVWKDLGTSAKRTTTTVGGARNQWHLDELDLGATCGGKAAGTRGVYLADVSSDQITVDTDRPWLTPKRRRVLANVTDMGVLIKVGPASGIVWVTSLATGAPIAGAKVSVYTPAGVAVTTATTDAEGLVRIPGSAIAKAQPSVDDSDDAGEGMEDEGFEDWDSYRSQRLIAIVEKSGDLAVVDGNWANGIQIWNFGLPEERRGGETRMRGFIQSDRGLYRPGEEVHFKGLVRELAQNQPPRVPKQRAVKVEVTDSRGTVVYADDAALSAFGGFHFDLGLEPEATLGDYYVKASLGNQVFRERFMVEEYRPAAFELDVKSVGAVRAGARLAFTANARYLFGAPVTDATVEWTLRRRMHVVRFEGYDEYAFGEGHSPWAWDYGYDGRDESDYGDFVADGTGTTDANGNLSIAARDPDRPSDSGPIDYIVAVNVTDDTDQTIGKSVVVTAHQQAMYLGVHTQEYVQAVGMPFGVNVVALDPDGKRVEASAKLSFIRDESRCTWTEVGRRGYQQCTKQQAVAIERTIQIPATGTATERIYPKDPGEYIVKIEATDAHGAKIATSENLWVLGKGEAFWSGDESARMTLVASKRSYLPGDTARLVAQANLVEPTALVTIERDGVLQAYTKKLASASEGIELTIDDAWAPNVYAGVTLVQGRRGPGDRNRPQMKMGMVELAVSSQAKALEVKIELDRVEVKPGDPVKGTIRVTAGGKPVKAELAVSVADEGVLQLIAYKTPNPLATFYAAFGLGVDAGTNWNRVAKLASPEGGDPDSGGDFASSNEGRIRSRFVSSAYWAPAVITDARGEATFAFAAPDNLTAFRVMAVAADAADRFGAGEQRLTVAKHLMARPALPRFLGSGDTTAVGLVIHNDTDKAGTARVTAIATGVTLDKGEATVDVPANGVAKVMFSAKASEVASARFDFAVAMNGDQDAVRITLPITRPRVVETRTVAKGELAAGGKTTIDLAVPNDVLRDESELVVTLDRSGLGDLEPSLAYLVEYPYGCLEQTMSRFVPLAKAKDLSKSLNLPGLDSTKMNAFLRAGVAKVARHQSGDGHFSLWPQSQTYPHLTALAVWGLDEAKKAGVAVPEDTIARGVEALKTWAAGSTVKPDGDGATMAMTAYLLAVHGVPDAALVERLYAGRAGLPMWGQAYLLRALHAGKASEAQVDTIRELIVGQLAQRGAGLVAPDDSGPYYMSTEARSTAMAISALLEVAPKDPSIEALVAGLQGLRGTNGRWVSTQENMWSLIALADYARGVGTGSTTTTVASAGTTLGAPTVTGGGLAVVRAPLVGVGAAIQLSATGKTHYSVRVVQKKRDDGAALTRGFSIQRAYLDDAGKPLTTVKAGDLVTVKLTLHTDADRAWVALVDPLPAGLEVVNPNLTSSVDTSRDPGATTTADRWWNVQWAHQEMHDDRVEWFADAMRSGTYELVYKARAATAGTFTVAPAHIEAMYEPDVMGRTASEKLTIAP
jgi:uncharacterized protein YfaS (alpha-2-macroglobulin family)